MPAPYKVGILGAGQIAQGFDHPGDVIALSMANAITQSPSFSLGGFFDVDASRSAKAESKWSCAVSPRERGAWLAQKWDVLYIATPDSQHAKDLDDAIAARPQAIIVEKPLALTSQETEQLMKKAAAARIPIIINFPRRFHSGVQAIARDIQNGVLGSPKTIVIAYSSSLAHNGVHLIDLFAQWWGTDWQFRVQHRNFALIVADIRSGAHDAQWIFVDAPIGTSYLLELRAYTSTANIELAESPEVLRITRPQTHPRYQDFAVFQNKDRYDMESEPLLLRTLNEVADLIQDPARAQKHMEQETAIQRFIGSVLDLSNREKEAVR